MALRHRSRAACLAISRRFCGLRTAARAGPPFNPPSRPSAAACSIPLKGSAATAHDLDPLGGRMTALAFPADLIRSLGLVAHSAPIADETLASNAQNHGLHADLSTQDRCPWVAIS